MIGNCKLTRAIIVDARAFGDTVEVSTNDDDLGMHTIRKSVSTLSECTRK